MDCSRIRRELSALADGELPQERLAAVEKHLEGCDDCSRASKDWSSLRQHFQALPREEAPRGLSERTLARIQAAGKSLQSTTPFLRFAAAAAAVLLLTTSLAILFTSPKSAPAKADPAAAFTADVALDRMMTELLMDNVPTVSGGEVDR